MATKPSATSSSQDDTQKPQRARQPAPRPKGNFQDRAYQNSTSVVARLRAQQRAQDKRQSVDEDDDDYEQAMDDSLPASRGPQGRLVAPLNDTAVLIKPLVECADGSKVAMNGGEGDVAPSWFRGVMSRKEADAILRRSPKGSFLVRASARQQNEYVLSCRECYPRDLCPHEIAHFPIKLAPGASGSDSFMLPPLQRRFTSLEHVVQELRKGIDDLALKLGSPAQ